RNPLAHEELIRAPYLSLRLEPGIVVLATPEGKVRLGEVAIRILDVFSAPHTIAGALSKLQRPGEGKAQWMRLSETILWLQRAGAIVPANADVRLGAPALVEAFGGAPIHISMLNDHRRVSAYLAAIAETVKPGDVVVDLGTGTGILALAAARAGARAVYAIEASAIGAAAEAMFERNGFADRIHLIRGWSTEVSLPERADVLVTETIGHDPFEERIAENMADARDRFLKPGARLIPERMRVWALPVSVPKAEADPVRFSPEAISQWGSDYGFDFSPLLSATPVRPLVRRLQTAVAREFPALADAMVIADVDISQPFTSAFDSSVDFVAATSGLLNGILIYFDLTLSPGVSFTTERETAEDTNSWGHIVIMLPDNLDISRGDELSLRVDRVYGRLRAQVTRSHSAP
ncbi:MAG TPA: 50S ribosomal protein L11 methyltransferase, partial [Gemmatimonadaceae bacterium]|nr:50S ribosomal protein L11 methyltransferase [Gemmatimonadaceae bacterium]